MSGSSDPATVAARPLGPGPGASEQLTSTGRRPLALRPVPPLDGIPAKLCPADHPNDLEATECRICDQIIQTATAVVEVPPEPLARILLEDGTAVDLQADLVVGRSPSLEETDETLVVAGRQVSRHHLLIEVHGWRLRLRDCDSTNGTYVSRQGERGRRRVPEGSAVPLRLGDTIHFGSRQALIVAHGR